MLVMSEISILCDNLLSELYKFSDEMLSLGLPIGDDKLEIFERDIKFDLPFDFVYILKKHNGISLTGTGILGLDKQLKGSSLDKVYKFEHCEVGNPMPAEFLPFSPDGFGNYYCLNLSKFEHEICPVVFWQHDIIYDDINDVEECNLSLLDWIQEVMIDWTLENTNYDGSDK